MSVAIKTYQQAVLLCWFNDNRYLNDYEPGTFQFQSQAELYKL